MLEQFEAIITRQAARWSVPGIVVGVLHDGQTELRAWGLASLNSGQPMRPEMLFRVASISKVFTATLAMTLVEDGLLDLDRPVGHYLPELRLADADALGTIAMRHLLSHQSGLLGDYFVSYDLGENALARWIGQFDQLRQITRPGEIWSYANSGFHLAGRVCEVLCGKPFDAAMRERVFAPLGLERSGFFAHEMIAWPHALGHNLAGVETDEHVVAPQYYPRNRLPAGGVVSNAAELLAFASFHMGDGVVAERQVLSAASLTAMRKPQIRCSGWADAWGLGWDLREIDGYTVISHGGSINGYQTLLTAVPAKRTALAVMTNSGRGSAACHPIEAAILAELCGLRAPEPRTIALPAAALERLAGRYRQQFATIDVSVEGTGLAAVVTYTDPVFGPPEPWPAVPLAPLSEMEFVITAGESAGGRVAFFANPDSTIRFIRMGGRLGERE